MMVAVVNVMMVLMMIYDACYDGGLLRGFLCFTGVMGFSMRQVNAELPWMWLLRSI